VVSIDILFLISIFSLNPVLSSLFISLSPLNAKQLKSISDSFT
jgi:hypothetical protein